MGMHSFCPNTAYICAWIMDLRYRFFFLGTNLNMGFEETSSCPRPSLPIDPDYLINPDLRREICANLFSSRAIGAGYTFRPWTRLRKKLSSAESLCRGEERREKGLGFSGPFDVIQSLTLTVKYKVSINERFGFNILHWTAEIDVMDIPIIDKRISTRKD